MNSFPTSASGIPAIRHVVFFFRPHRWTAKSSLRPLGSGISTQNHAKQTSLQPRGNDVPKYCHQPLDPQRSARTTPQLGSHRRLSAPADSRSKLSSALLMRRHCSIWPDGFVTSTLDLTQIGLPQQRARCADGNGTLSSLFFSDNDLELTSAQSICQCCPLQTTCLAGAVERREVYGVWGGMIVQNGVPTIRRRRRGRPRRRPIDSIVADEVPASPDLIA